ncbi:MAG: low molecular weight protein arginine phosphatase [Candidatus Omnitrophota bacterium]|nr:low molecular weight protein arginine phosphatase [Candidatus Omnitrophota bacterium]
MSNIKSVLFVCTGNSCRSVMAEGLLKKRLKELGKTGIEVKSAGVRAIAGFPPTDETISVMKESGADVSGHKSKNLTDEMIKASDIILVMEPLHKFDVIRRVPDAASKTYILQEFADKGKSGKHEKESGVPDPIGNTIDYYKKCLDVINKEINKIAEML